MLPVMLALAASAAWGCADFLGGHASRGVSALTVATVSKLAGVTGLAIAVLAVGDLPSGAAAAWSLAAGVLGAVGLVALYRALALGPMSLVAPLTACGGAVPVIVAFALGDVPGPVTAVGLACAFTGAVVVSRPSGSDAAVPGMRRAALWTAVVAALAIGFAIASLQRAAQAPDSSAIGIAFVAALASVPVLLAIAGSRGAAVPPPAALLPAVIGCGLLDVSANVLLAQATAEGSAAVVAVLGSLYPLATVLLARTLLAERLSRSQAAGVLAAVGGVALIAAGG